MRVVSGVLVEAVDTTVMDWIWYCMMHRMHEKVIVGEGVCQYLILKIIEVNLVRRADE